MVAMILRSLQKSFHSLTTVLETRADDELRLELVNEVPERCTGARGESVLMADLKKSKITCHFCHKQKYWSCYNRVLIKEVGTRTSLVR